jgi:hypothetical protein
MTIKRHEVKQRMLVEEEKKSKGVVVEKRPFYLLWGGAFFSFAAHRPDRAHTTIGRRK